MQRVQKTLLNIGICCFTHTLIPFYLSLSVSLSLCVSCTRWNNVPRREMRKSSVCCAAFCCLSVVCMMKISIRTRATEAKRVHVFAGAKTSLYRPVRTTFSGYTEWILNTHRFFGRTPQTLYIIIVFHWKHATRFWLFERPLHYICVCVCRNLTIPFKIKGPFSQVFLYQICTIVCSFARPLCASHKKRNREETLARLTINLKRDWTIALSLIYFRLHFIIVAYSNFSWSTKIAKL